MPIVLTQNQLEICTKKTSNSFCNQSDKINADYAPVIVESHSTKNVNNLLMGFCKPKLLGKNKLQSITRSQPQFI
jgi:hypothetical protein